MVSYVFLVIIAVTLAIAVYAGLRAYLPREKAECPEAVSIVIKDIISNSDGVRIVFQNKGTFTVRGVIIKMSDKEEGEITYLAFPSDTGGFFGIREPGYFYFGISGLESGEVRTVYFDPKEVEEMKQSIKRIQVQPFVQGEDESEIAFCEHAILIRNIE